MAGMAAVRITRAPTNAIEQHGALLQWRAVWLHRGFGESQEKMFQSCALGISHDEQKINPRIIILH
jgi:hypothetical protein